MDQPGLWLSDGVKRSIKADPQFSTFVFRSLKKFLQDDWGSAPDELKKENDENRKNGGSLMALYIFENFKYNSVIFIEASPADKEGNRKMAIMFSDEMQPKDEVKEEKIDDGGFSD